MTTTERGDPAPFDVCGDLPMGTTLLEASAGTGKTFTIAALATRYVAERGLDLGRLMLVTFGRAATQELRERVRERLVLSERMLRDPGRARASDDTAIGHLANADDTTVDCRRDRLAAALASFDAATITTTHGFCQQMLRGLGLAGDFEPQSTFVESVDDLIVDVASDLYVSRWCVPAAAGSAPPMPYNEALDLALNAVQDRHTRLEPRNADRGSPPAERVAFAQAVRAEVSRRKRALGLRDYDDLLTLLRDAMAEPGRGDVAVERVRSRYDVVMVDEFQDTDPVQWDILRRAFHGHTALVLIGDPKQAIYAFRGGDITTYLQAGRVAEQRATLVTNWRSDQPLVTGLAHLFGEAALGDKDIVVRPVVAHHPRSRLNGDSAVAPVRLRYVTRPDDVETIAVGALRAAIAADVAADVVRLLAGQVRLEREGVGESSSVAPGDVAVLVSRNEDAVQVHAALQDVGVPAVLTGAVDVFTTPMAREWQVLLQALESPNHDGRARTVALGCFVGWDAASLATHGDNAMDTLRPMLSSWAEVLEQRGVPAVLETIVAQRGLLGRLLRLEDGERQMTDLRQIGEALHAAATAEHLGVAALGQWLGGRIEDAKDKRGDIEARSRRLESDADAVQVLTIWRSKGLEFPIVYVPFAWSRYVDSASLPRFHDADGTRCRDVGGKDGPDYGENAKLDKAEGFGEDLRQLYVALTRARSQVVAWWAPNKSNTPSSPLHRLLFGGHARRDVPRDKSTLPADPAVRERFDAIARESDGTVVMEEVAPSPSTVGWRPPRAAPADLTTARFDRSPDVTWRRTSYSALTAAAHDAAYERDSVGGGVTSEAGEPGLDDEPDAVQVADEPAVDLLEEGLRRVRSPMASLPGGTTFGIVVHSVLERVDTSAPDLSAELTARSSAVLAQRLATAYQPEALGAALLPAVQTPLGELAGGTRLCDIMPSDRLAELDFELPLAGGDRPVDHTATVRAIATLLRDRLPAGDPLAPYAERLERPELARSPLRGYLTGSLDAVIRLRGVTGESRYLVVDYKTNWLGPTIGSADGAAADELSAWHYRSAAMSEAMLNAHYPLQLLLYLVALHRYLRGRHRGYDPDVHLGGGLYLFLRGMCGPETPIIDGVPCGVFGWAPPGGLVVALSRLLAGGAT